MQALEIVDRDDRPEGRDLPRHVRRRGRVEQHRGVDSLVADLAHVFRIADGKGIRTAFERRPPGAPGAAAKAVALDDGEDPDLGTHPPPDEADVVLQGPEIDLDPGRSQHAHPLALFGRDGVIARRTPMPAGHGSLPGRSRAACR